MAELSDSVYDEIKRLCSVGDQYAADAEYRKAITEYSKAWELIPEPKNDREASIWVLAAIGDACFLLQAFKSAREALEFAMTCPGAIGNPFIHFRLGQCQFELGNLERAADELMRAYMGSGRDLFDREDPKYFQFLQDRAEDIR